MGDFVRPVDAVREAMPGTLGDLVERTGYPADKVLSMIGRMRTEGVRVNAQEDGITRNVNRYVDSDNPVTSTTVYTVDNSRGIG